MKTFSLGLFLVNYLIRRWTESIKWTTLYEHKMPVHTTQKRHLHQWIPPLLDFMPNISAENSCIVESAEVPVWWRLTGIEHAALSNMCKAETDAYSLGRSIRWYALAVVRQSWVRSSLLMEMPCDAQLWLKVAIIFDGWAHQCRKSGSTSLVAVDWHGARSTFKHVQGRDSCILGVMGLGPGWVKVLSGLTVTLTV